MEAVAFSWYVSRCLSPSNIIYIKSIFCSPDEHRLMNSGMLSFYVNVCMFASPAASEWLDVFVMFSTFRSVLILGLCPVNLNFPPTLEMGPQNHEIIDFLEVDCNDFD
jgi:hypothetical protein